MQKIYTLENYYTKNLILAQISLLFTASFVSYRFPTFASAFCALIGRSPYVPARVISAFVDSLFAMCQHSLHPC